MKQSSYYSRNTFLASSICILFRKKKEKVLKDDDNGNQNSNHNLSGLILFSANGDDKLSCSGQQGMLLQATCLLRQEEHETVCLPVFVFFSFDFDSS